jgi:hypothetical protein
MKTTVNAATLAAGLLALGTVAAGPAMAFGGMCDEQKDKKMTPERMEQMQKKQEARFKEHMETLEKALVLRPDQAAAWGVYRQAHLDTMKARMDAAPLMRGADQAPLSAPEQMAKKEEMVQTHLTHIREMRAHTERFYGQLDATQQKAFDAHMAERRGYGPHH